MQMDSNIITTDKLLSGQTRETEGERLAMDSPTGGNNSPQAFGEDYKIRSVSACVRDAYTLFHTNLKTILGRCGKAISAFAICWGLVMAFQMQHVYVEEIGITASIVGALLVVAMIVGEVWLIAAAFKLVNSNSLRGNVVRTSKAMLSCMGVSFIFGMMVSMIAVVAVVSAQGGGQPAQMPAPQVPNSLMWGTVAVGLLTLLYLLLLVPLAYMAPRYINESDAKYPTHFLRSYGIGFRHYGFLLGNLLLSGLVATIISAIEFLPLGVLFVAQVTSAEGVLGGDAVGLPGYFDILLYGTAIITGVLASLVLIWMLYVLYYAYLSIEAKETERKKNKVKRVSRANVE